MNFRLQSSWSLSIFMVGIAGCASLQNPPSDLLTKIPIVEIGKEKPQGNEYILFVPAGKDVPIKLSVGGSFLSEEGFAETKVKLRQDLYLYKYWSSFDGRNWKRSHGVFDTIFSAGLEPAGGKVEIKVNKVE